MSAATPAKRVYLALGSNIAPEVNLPAAIQTLQTEFGAILACSSVWQSPATGSDGPYFLNAVVLIETQLSPAELKVQVFRPLEARMGRVRGADKNAPRPIDIDIAVYDDIVVDEEIWTRAHMAIPFTEIFPGFPHPESGRLIGDIAGELQASTAIIRRDDLLLLTSD